MPDNLITMGQTERVMMRKPSKTTLKRKLDKAVSEIVRSRGKCEHCERTENLQCAHIISRTNLNLRWNLQNLLCLCPNCHINFAHKNPLMFAEWVKEYLGEAKYHALKVGSWQIKKWSIDEMSTLLKTLTKD